MNIRNVANLGLAVAMVAFTSCNNQKRQASLNSEIDSVSYALGLDISKNIENVFKQSNKSCKPEKFINAKLKVKDLHSPNSFVISLKKFVLELLTINSFNIITL